MKKLIAMGLMLALLCGNAYALEQAAGSVEWSRLERYSSFQQEETVWSVRSNQTEAALYRMTLSTAPLNGYVCFGMELTGDRETGVTVPVLAFYYAGETALNAEFVSVVANGVRYDLAVYSEQIQISGKSIERMSAPLDAEGLNMVRVLSEADEVCVALQGNVVIEAQAVKKSNYLNVRDELVCRSLQALDGMLQEFEAVKPYELWDLNEAWWMRTFGVQPNMQRMTLSEESTIYGIGLQAPMYMIVRGACGENVRALQELLIANGYLQGRADGIYGTNTAQAVSAAQKWLGWMPTGSADEALIRALNGESSVNDNEKALTDSAQMRTAEGLCELTIDRFWFADAVESSGGDRRSVLDRDDTMVIYEGNIKNLSKSSLDFYWQISAVVRCGEYEYDCVTVCERNEGMSLSSTLPPLGEARLLIYAEIPENIAGEGEWTLEISAGEHQFLFD